MEVPSAVVLSSLCALWFLLSMLSKNHSEGGSFLYDSGEDAGLAGTEVPSFFPRPLLQSLLPPSHIYPVPITSQAQSWVLELCPQGVPTYLSDQERVRGTHRRCHGSRGGTYITGWGGAAKLPSGGDH